MLLGIIYRITFPQRKKCYIGQTRQELRKRTTNHIYEALNMPEDKGSWLLNSKIRKYGAINMIVSIVERCDIVELDAREIFNIAKFNSRAPNGWNLTAGGALFGDIPLTEEDRNRMSQNQRKYFVDANLPRFISRREEYNGAGFIVAVPGYNKKQFCSSELGSMERKMELAIEYLKKIQNNEIPPKIDRKHPSYFQETRQNGEKCFKISRPGFQTKKFFFTDETYVAALFKAEEYHEQVMEGTAPLKHKLRQDPLYDQPDMQHIQRKSEKGCIVFGPNKKTKSFASTKFTPEENIRRAKEYRDQVWGIIKNDQTNNS